MIKLSKLAKHLGVTKATLYNWRLAGKISFIKSEGGQNYVSNETYNELLGIKEKKEDSVVIYCRVSSSENKNNLETQKERMISYCNAKGYKVHSVITEIGSVLTINVLNYKIYLNTTTISLKLWLNIKTDSLEWDLVISKPYLIH